MFFVSKFLKSTEDVFQVCYHSHQLESFFPRFLVGSFERHFDSRLGLEPWQTGIFGFYKAGGFGKDVVEMTQLPAEMPTRKWSQFENIWDEASSRNF